MGYQDTLVTDTALLHAWGREGDYDYQRELVQTGESVWEWLMRQADHALGKLFGSGFYSDHETLIWTIVILIAVAIVIAVIYYSSPHLFYRRHKAEAAEVDNEDNIYGVDFAAAIAKALSIGDFRQAVRMVYLQTLRALADSHLIDWQPSKTPTQYTREYHGQPLSGAALQSSSEAAFRQSSEASLQPSSEAAFRQSSEASLQPSSEAAFRQMTLHFLRVRYGDFPATEALYKEMVALQKQVSVVLPTALAITVPSAPAVTVPSALAITVPPSVSPALAITVPSSAKEPLPPEETGEAEKGGPA